MTSQSPASPRTIFLIVIAMIVLWGIYLMIGAFLERPARALVLFLCFAGFLGFWWGAFQLRKRRLAREEREREVES